MPWTAGVGRADEIFAVSVGFETVGHFFAVRLVTKDQSIRRALKPRVFHEFPVDYGFVKIAQTCLLSVSDFRFAFRSILYTLQ